MQFYAQDFDEEILNSLTHYLSKYTKQKKKRLKNPKRKILRKKIKENDEQVDLRYTLLKKEFLEGFSENFIRKSIYSYRERLKKKIFFLNYEYSLIG
jgi:hypothetical protein